MVRPLAYARTAIFDSTLTLCTAAAIVWFADERPVGAWAAMAVGALTKGPIAIAIPLLALVSHAAATGTSVRRLFPWRGGGARGARRPPAAAGGGRAPPALRPASVASLASASASA